MTITRWVSAHLVTLFVMAVGLLTCCGAQVTALSSFRQDEKRLMILGLGNVGTAVATEAVALEPFRSVVGTKRSVTHAFVHDDEESKESKTKFKTVLFDLPFIKEHLPTFSHVLITIPPRAFSDNDSRRRELMNIFKQYYHAGGWLGIVSTTGVYGNHDGAWVDESSPLLCSKSTSAFEYIQWERDWEAVATDVGLPQCCIFRCAGLYGPSRSALHTLWKKGVSSEAKVHSRNGIGAATGALTNRIHEFDVSRAIVACMTKSSTSSSCGEKGSATATTKSTIYNLSDDKPECRSTVIDYAAHLFHTIDLEVPSRRQSKKSVSAPTTRKERSSRRGKDLKLVSNAKMKRELIPDLIYPTYREGLDAILQDKRRSPWWRGE